MIKPESGNLFGMLATPAVTVTLDVARRQVASVIGADVKPEGVILSDLEMFGLPAWVEFDNLRLFPTSYEFHATGSVVYHAHWPPNKGIEIDRRLGLLSERSRIIRARLSPGTLSATRGQHRKPTQNQVMGESASVSAARIQTSGALRIPEGLPVTWHWCHLVAVSLWPAKRAQQRRNILLGTAAVNGQMICIERALRWYVRRYEATVSLEVTCTFLAETPLGLRLRYQLHDRRTGGLHREYFDLFGHNPAAVSEGEELARRVECALRK